MYSLNWNYCEIVEDSHVVVRNTKIPALCALYPISSNVSILQESSVIWQPGQRHRYNPPITCGFLWFHLASYVFSSIQFCHLFMTPGQSRHWTGPAPQASMKLLPCNYTHLPQVVIISPPSTAPWIHSQFLKFRHFSNFTYMETSVYNLWGFFFST